MNINIAPTAAKKQLTEVDIYNVPKEAIEYFEILCLALECSFDAIFVREDDLSHFLYVNASACHSLGYTKEELIEKRVPDINPDLSEAELIRIHQSVKENEPLFVETRHIHKDGTIFPVEVSIIRFQHQGKH